MRIILNAKNKCQHLLTYFTKSCLKKTPSITHFMKQWSKLKMRILRIDNIFSTQHVVVHMTIYQFVNGINMLCKMDFIRHIFFILNHVTVISRSISIIQIVKPSKISRSISSTKERGKVCLLISITWKVK